MSRNVFYVGIDVDDARYHRSARDKCTREVLAFRYRPTLIGLAKMGKQNFKI